MATDERPQNLIEILFQPHPWHGVAPGPLAPEQVTVYVEIVPSDDVKYELDKATGFLKVDRPQQFSSACPSLYGFVPQTYCGERVAGLAARSAGKDLVGDGDPLDICVLSERAIAPSRSVTPVLASARKIVTEAASRAISAWRRTAASSPTSMSGRKPPVSTR